jgi:uncharacterized protein
LNEPGHLLDVNALIALSDRNHRQHGAVLQWFESPGLVWGLCAFSEAGFLRLATHPAVGARTLKGAIAILEDLASRPGYRYWPVTAEWTTLTAPFRERIYGHQQITDSFLLGLAVQQGGVLVTLDKAILHMAGADLSRHVLVLG